MRRRAGPPESGGNGDCSPVASQVQVKQEDRQNNANPVTSATTEMLRHVMRRLDVRLSVARVIAQEIEINGRRSLARLPTAFIEGLKVAARAVADIKLSSVGGGT